MTRSSEKRHGRAAQFPGLSLWVVFAWRFDKVQLRVNGPAATDASTYYFDDFSFEQGN